MSSIVFNKESRKRGDQENYYNNLLVSCFPGFLREKAVN
jgi:hypothetical protein